jgi:hypothetical protein
MDIQGTTLTASTPLLLSRRHQRYRLQVDPKNVLPEYPRPQMVRNNNWKVTSPYVSFFVFWAPLTQLS